MVRETRLHVAGAVVDGALIPGDVAVVGDRVEAVGLPSPTGRGVAVPGFVDLQVNGFAGVDFLDATAADLVRAGEHMLRTGVTTHQPTLITAPEDVVTAALSEVAGARATTGRRILGVHLEGPFLSPDRAGTHPTAWMRDPDGALLDRLLATGPVTSVTLAPERPGALTLVRDLLARGVTVWAGHTDADSAAAHAGFDAGIRAVTHLFNAMRPLHHRDAGVVGVALARDDVTIGLVVDPTHLAADVVRLVLAAARGRVALVTDAIAAAGCGDGRWRLGGMDVEVVDGVARRVEDGVLAGSVLTMDAAVRHVVDLGIPLAEAVTAATRTPAALVGRPDLGVLRPGSRADVVVLDDDLQVVRVLCDGRDAW